MEVEEAELTVSLAGRRVACWAIGDGDTGRTLRLVKLDELGAWGSGVGSQGRNAVAHGPRTFHGAQKAWAKFPGGPHGPVGCLQRGPCVARGHLVTEEQKKAPQPEVLRVWSCAAHRQSSITCGSPPGGRLAGLEGTAESGKFSLRGSPGASVQGISGVCGDTVSDHGRAVHTVRGKGGLVTESSSDKAAEDNQRPEGFIPHRMGP